MWTVELLDHEHPRAGRRNATTRQGPSFFLKRCDQTFGAKFLEQIEDLTFANVGIDLIRGEQCPTEITNSNRLCEQLPDARTHPVHPVADAPLNAESHNLVIDFGLDEIVPTRDDFGTILER
jgi:hypothetical protein